MRPDESTLDSAEAPPPEEKRRLDQLRRLARLPLTEKLRWLEQAHRLVRALQSGRPPFEG